VGVMWTGGVWLDTASREPQLSHSSLAVHTPSPPPLPTATTMPTAAQHSSLTKQGRGTKDARTA